MTTLAATPYRGSVERVRCACGRPERCWPDSETCAFMDTGSPWCRVCKENHRAPECVIDATAESTPAVLE